MSIVWSGITIKGPDGETFSFPASFVSGEDMVIGTGVSRTVMPVAGPMSNIGNNFEGNEKTITINGVLYDTVDEDVSVVSNKNIKTIKLMKYYLEACKMANSALEYESEYNGLSLVSASGTTTIDGVAIPGQWIPTKGYVVGFTADKPQEDIEGMPFTLNLWVAGS